MTVTQAYLGADETQIALAGHIERFGWYDASKK